VAPRTFFAVAAPNVNLAFDDSAIVAAVLICSPVVYLTAIPHSLELLFSDENSRVILRFLNLLRPALDHFLALVSNELAFHRPNENKMSDGYRERALIEVKVF
jgi:hypothetical protein